MATTDEELMTRYRAGDAAAFETLYRRHRGPVFRYVARTVGAGTDVEALFQDVWLRVIASHRQWRPDQPFTPWLYRIAHNRVVDHWRREGRLDRDTDADLAALPDEACDPDLLAWLRDCVQRLMALLARLPEVQRSAFLLKEEAGLNLAQIGEVTGVERETVKSRLRYAIRRLRAGLEGCDE